MGAQLLVRAIVGPLGQEVEVEVAQGRCEGSGLDGRRAEQGDDPLERNPDPAGPVVQLVEQLIKGLVEQERVEEPGNLVGIFGEEAARLGPYSGTP